MEEVKPDKSIIAEIDKSCMIQYRERIYMFGRLKRKWNKSLCDPYNDGAKCKDPFVYDIAKPEKPYISGVSNAKYIPSVNIQSNRGKVDAYTVTLHELDARNGNVVNTWKFVTGVFSDHLLHRLVLDHYYRVSAVATNSTGNSLPSEWYYFNTFVNHIDNYNKGSVYEVKELVCGDTLFCITELVC